MSPKKKDSYDEGYDDAGDNFYDQAKYKYDREYRDGHQMRELELTREKNENEREQRRQSLIDRASNSDNFPAFENSSSPSNNDSGENFIGGCAIYIGVATTVAGLAILTIAAGSGLYIAYTTIGLGILLLITGISMRK